jgi:hypothetical protein
MAHFAEVKDGIVTRVIVVSNNDAPDETAGQAFIQSIGLDGDWVQTSYNGNPVGGVDRGPYAGIGYSWDGDKFAAPVAPEPAPEEIPAP